MNGNAGNAPKPSPLLKAAKLWAKSSVKGGQYLTGRLGGVKILVLENRDRKADDDPSHHLFFTEAAPHPGAQERSDGSRAPQLPLAGQRPSQPQRSVVQGHGGDGDDDGPPWER
jgi:hypothetical protein